MKNKELKEIISDPNASTLDLINLNVDFKYLNDDKKKSLKLYFYFITIVLKSTEMKFWIYASEIRILGNERF